MSKKNGYKHDARKQVHDKQDLYNIRTASKWFQNTYFLNQYG